MAQGQGQTRGSQFRASLLAALLLGCAGNDGKEYTAAAIGLAGTIGATAMYRAHTGRCWANCSLGYACDRPSGLCRQIECIPECAPSKTCVIEPDQSFRCVNAFGSGQFGATPPAPVMSSVPAASATPPASSASPN